MYKIHRRSSSPKYEIDVTQLHDGPSLWFIFRSNSFKVWYISFILLKLLHSIMGPLPLNSGISSLTLHEYQWYGRC